MIVKVKYFSSIKDRIGKEYDSFNVDEEFRVRDLKNLIKQTYPDAFGKYPIFVSINYRYSEDNEKIGKDDEVALMPAISGG